MSKIIASTYEVMEEIGAGGGGVVYLANHLRLHKKVVLKADKRTLSARPELLRREVDVLKNLSHPYIPQVYDFFVEDETVYTVMAYIEGESLDKPLKRGEKFSQPQVIRWAIQLLEALCYLHSPTHGTPPRGYVHSDIKPANLMRTPNNDICLIDFNIALALGEENVIGCSIGYASPEHYGLDFSSEYDRTETGNTGRRRLSLLKGSSGRETSQGRFGPKPGSQDTTATVRLTEEETVKLSDREKSGAAGQAAGGRGTSSPKSTSSGSGSSRKIIPDIRSDIYSVGATLYHLLSGTRPARDAKEVVPLSPDEFSPQIAAIISRAMEPNPELRFQTAEEMLDAFLHLRDRDPRALRLKKERRIVGAILAVCFMSGVACSFVGLKRMQVTENRLKLAEYSRNAYAKGDSETAVSYAMQALAPPPGLLTPKAPAQAQKALADALGVYDLSDGFKTHLTVELPSAPFSLEISPDGRTACCLYAYEMAVIDMETAETLAVLPTVQSALAEVEYVDDHRVVFSGQEGIQLYDIEKGETLWTGDAATGISISGDGSRVAAVFREDTFAAIYDTSSGELLQRIDFGGKHQQVVANDSFANPNDNLFALNEDGSLLGISFADGSLRICDVEDPAKDELLLDAGSGYGHFEGGFYQQYFAFSASGQKHSVFAVVDTETMEQTGGFETEGYFGVKTDETGIFVLSENILVKLHPVTGEQTPLVTTSETIRCFDSDGRTAIATEENAILFFDGAAQLFERQEIPEGCDFARLAGAAALAGSRNTPVVRILKYENHPEAERFSYDIADTHKEARLSKDGKTVMLFDYEHFSLYAMDGTLLERVALPDPGQIYDQQYRRTEEGSWLEVIYNDGTVRTYSAADGTLLQETKGERPDPSLQETFLTDRLRIESPLHEAATVYDRKTGKKIRELEQQDYLTYVTQAGPYLVAQYVTAEGSCYGRLMDENCEVLADLPCLCDVIGETLLFDYPTGNLRSARIYDIGELKEIAQAMRNGGVQK